MFTDDEVAMGVELFDEAFEGEGLRVDGGVSNARPSTLDPRPSTYEFLGAFDSAGGLVGYACYGPTPGTDRTFDLYWIAVHPAAQGAGEGSRLLAEVERRLRAREARLLVAETSSRANYAPTRRFYERRGYRRGPATRELHDLSASVEYFFSKDLQERQANRESASPARPSTSPP
jgi:ribosomal protein S18 acetylase RimI-like enzyme